MSIPSCLRPLRGGSPRHRAWRGLGLVLALVVLGEGQPVAAQYTFIDLHPSGFTERLSGKFSERNILLKGVVPSKSEQEVHHDRYGTEAIRQRLD